jgi:hypothetical protein
MLLFAHISYFFCSSAKLNFCSLFPSMDFTYLHGYVWLYSSITNKLWTGYVYNSVVLKRAMHTKNKYSFHSSGILWATNTWKLDTEPIHCSDSDTLLVVLAVSLYAHFVIGVIQEITSALGIYCFRYQTCQFHYQVLCLNLFLHFSSYRFIEQIVPLGLQWF